jgi:hypothetical protein
VASHDGSKPTWGAKPVAQIKRLVKAHGPAEVIRRIAMLRDSPPRWPTAPWDLATFVQHFDKLTTAPSRSDGPSFFDIVDAVAAETREVLS